MILKMTRVQIMGIRSDLQKVVNKLHHLGTLQIDDINNIPDISAQELSLSADTQKAQEDSKYLITQIRGLIESLGCIPSKENLSSNETSSLEEIRKNVNQLIPQIHELNLHKRDSAPLWCDFEEIAADCSIHCQQTGKHNCWGFDRCFSYQDP